MGRALKRICGFSMWKELPSESTFSHVFAEFAEARLAKCMHAALLKEMLGEQLIGHISRDGTAIEAREKPAKRDKSPKPVPAAAKKRGRPRQDESLEAKPGTIKQQQLKLAREFDLPVLPHTRRAQATILKHLRQIVVRGGSRQQADEFIKLGFKSGFGGAMTYTPPNSAG